MKGHFNPFTLNLSFAIAIYMSIESIVKFIGFVNIIKYFRDYLEKKSGRFYKAVKAHRLDSEKKHFESIYFNATDKFGQTVPEEIVKLFASEEIRNAFKAEYSGQKKSAVFPILEYNMQNDPSLQVYLYDIHNLITKFTNIFLACVKDSLSVQEQHQEKHFEGIKQELSTIATTTSSLPNIADNQEEIIGILQRIEAQAIFTQKTVSTRSYDGEIGRMLSLAAEHKNLSAIKVYEQFRTSEWENLTNLQRYDICSSIGVAYIELGEHEKAAKLFIELPALDVFPQEAFGLAALGYALLGDKAAAEKNIELARKEDPQSPHATQAAISLLNDDCTLEELEKAIPPEQLSNIMVGLEAALIYINHLPAHRAKARSILEHLLNTYTKRDLGYHEIQQLLGIVLITQVRDVYFKAGRVLSEENRKGLLFAVKLLTDAWNFYKNTDLRDGKWHLLSNRGMAHKMLGNWEDAIQDLEQSIHIQPTTNAYHGLIDLYREHNKPLTHLLKRMRNDLTLNTQQTQELDKWESESLLVAEKFSEVLQKVDKLLPETVDLNHSLQLQTFKIYALDGLGRREEAMELVQELAEQNPDNPFINTIAAEFSMKANQYIDAKAYLKMAISVGKDNLSFHHTDQIVKLSLELGEYENVIELLDHPQVYTKRSPWTYMLLRALSVSGEYQKAFDIAAPLYDPNDFDIDISQALLIKYSHDGDFNKMEEIARSSIAHLPEDGFLHVKLLAALLGSGRVNLALDHLAILPDSMQSPTNFLELLFAVVRIHGTAYMSAAMECAYNIVNNNPNDDNVLEGYTQLLKLVIGLGYQAEPGVVSNDCYVQLITENSEILNIIIEDDKISPRSFALSSLEGQELVGKKVNDFVLVNGVRYRINEVFSKYVFPLYNL
jgi:tetratricopeptide (TPR) repeat protein